MLDRLVYLKAFFPQILQLYATIFVQGLELVPEIGFERGVHLWFNML